MSQDKLMFYILSRLDRFGHEKLPLQIIKEKQSYIIGHKCNRFSDGSEFLDKACKLTYVKIIDMWKLYWMRADLNFYAEYQNLDKLSRE